jgi:imidazolonepropionase-like amidohydrolase/Tol biopolymer transport system component
MFAFKSAACAASILLFARCAAPGNSDWRTIEFETTEVTAPDVAISPDGEWLIFTMLGHLFRVPVVGGEAEQLTFGPYQDMDPAVSPDGARVAFGSNRDGTDGNIFVLNLADGRIDQLTHDSMAGRPAWAPDGSAIAYLRRRTRSFHCPSGRAGVARVAMDGREAVNVVGADDVISSVFYLPDGRLAWSAIEPSWPRTSTRIDVLLANESVETLDTLSGAMGRVLADAAGTGLYGRGYPRGASGEEQRITTLPMPPCLYLATAGFAVTPTGDAVYLSEAGRLWKYSVRDSVREPIPFRAKITLQVRDPIAPRAAGFPEPGDPLTPVGIMSPTLSPGGESLVFGAFDHLWQQATDGGPARRLVDGDGHEREPVLSPDGRHLLFISSGAWKQRVQLLDLETREIQTLAAGLLYWDPAWSHDGRRVVFGGIDPVGSRLQLVVVDLADGTTEQLAVPRSGWLSRPQFSADGTWLYYSAQPGTTRSLYRLRVDGEAEPQEFIALDRHLHDPLLSPDGQWLAFRRNTEIWLAQVGREAGSGYGQIRRVSREGGDNFTFTPDGTALLYASGNRVWRQPITGGERMKIPIRLNMLSPPPPSVLIQHVRVLDFTTGGFGEETSMYVEGGRIRWVGAEREQELRRDVAILDAGGRFAIPGLFDMHVHANAGAHGWFRSEFQEAWLAYGVTSVREAGNDLAFSANLADRSEATGDPVPRYFFSGNVFCGELGALPWESVPGAASFQLTDEADVRFYVGRWNARGVHFIKTHPCLAWPLQRALADEARHQGLPVMEHGNWHEWLIRSVTLGSGFVEHFDSYHDDVLQLLAAAGTGWSPTLTLSLADVALLEPGRTANPKLKAFAIEGLLEHQQSHYAEADERMWREERSKQLSVIGAAYRRGVRLYAGTDAPYGPVPGASLHRELRSFVNAGIPALQVLRIATLDAASAVGAAEHLGTLEVGKLADIVLLDANPLDDIENTQSIWRVIKGGWVFDPDALRADNSLAGGQVPTGGEGGGAEANGRTVP